MSLDNNSTFVIFVAEVLMFICFYIWVSFEPLRVEASKVRDQLLSQYYDKVEVKAERKEEDAKL